MSLINKKRKNILRSNEGFLVADFLFSFVLVISIGIIIFALTFSLATIEIAQYIVWSTARNFSAANVTESAASTQAQLKFNNMSQQFPLLTGNGSQSAPWFELTFEQVGDLSKLDTDLTTKIPGSDLTNTDGAGEQRQPWIGASARINLKLFTSLRIPFLGKAVDDPSKFTFPVRAFIMRHPSFTECSDFFKYENRFEKGIKKADPAFSNMSGNMASPPSPALEQESYVSAEDNGC